MGTDGKVPIGSASPVIAYFGQSVSVSGDTIVVGAYYDDVTDGATDTGAAYLFRAEGTEWVVEKVTASDAAGGDGFGYSVSISGDTVIVGAPWEDDGSTEVSQVTNAGAAYVFHFGRRSFHRALC